MVDQRIVAYICRCPDCRRDSQGALAKDHRAINRVVAQLDEKRRRLFTGLLASQLGHGGISRVARITGLSRTTILRGIRELARPGGSGPRVRQPGGRKRVEKKRRAS